MLSPFVRALSIASKKKKYNLKPSPVLYSLLIVVCSFTSHSIHSFLLCYSRLGRSFIYTPIIILIAIYGRWIQCPQIKKSFFIFHLFIIIFFFASLSHSLTLYTSAFFLCCIFPSSIVPQLSTILLLFLVLLISYAVTY